MQLQFYLFFFLSVWKCLLVVENTFCTYEILVGSQPCQWFQTVLKIGFSSICIIGGGEYDQVISLLYTFKEHFDEKTSRNLIRKQRRRGWRCGTGEAAGGRCLHVSRPGSTPWLHTAPLCFARCRPGGPPGPCHGRTQAAPSLGPRVEWTASPSGQGRGALGLLSTLGKSETKTQTKKLV